MRRMIGDVMPDHHHSLVVAFNKLARLGDLDDADRDAFFALPFQRVTTKAEGDIVSEGGEVEHCSILLSGFACRYKMSGYQRQIVSFLVPGDILDTQHMQLPRADHSIGAITAVTFLTVPSAAVLQLAQDRPAFGQAFWRDTLIDASIFREWVLNIGRRDAKMRVAHLFCELAVRIEAAGLGTPECFDLPITQVDIGDATGLTPVHVNRMLGALRADGLIEHKHRQVRIQDWTLLCRAADFQPAYLHEAA